MSSMTYNGLAYRELERLATYWARESSRHPYHLPTRGFGHAVIRWYLASKRHPTGTFTPRSERLTLESAVVLEYYTVVFNTTK